MKIVKPDDIEMIVTQVNPFKKVKLEDEREKDTQATQVTPVTPVTPVTQVNHQQENEEDTQRKIQNVEDIHLDTEVLQRNVIIFRIV